MNKNIISISGDIGSGKSTIGGILKEKLSYDIYSNGLIGRNMAKKLNMNINEFCKYIEKHPEIDLRIEDNLKEYAKNHDNFIIDAKLGFYTVPESFKVYLKVDINESAKRLFRDKKRKDTENYSSIKEYKKYIIERFNSENKRYFNLYNINREDMTNYDLVIDTTNLTILEVVNIILDEYNKYLNS